MGYAFLDKNSRLNLIHGKTKLILFYIHKKDKVFMRLKNISNYFPFVIIIRIKHEDDSTWKDPNTCSVAQHLIYTLLLQWVFLHFITRFLSIKIRVLHKIIVNLINVACYLLNEFNNVQQILHTFGWFLQQMCFVIAILKKGNKIILQIIKAMFHNIS